MAIYYYKRRTPSARLRTQLRALPERQGDNMKFCRHDWHIHKNGQRSKRYKTIIGNDGADTSSVIIWLGSSVSIFSSSLVICYKLIPNSMQTPGAFLVSVLLGIIYLCVYICLANNLFEEKRDPWVAQDKTCVKCDLVVLDATEEEDRLAKVNAVLLIKKEKRDVLVKKTDERYARWIEMRKRANV